MILQSRKDPKVKHFRIDGKVADTVLESYAPTFTTPYGATIYKYVGTGNPETDQFDTSNTSKWSTTLEADFVGQDDEVILVVYMVVSENGTERVFYHITVEDIEYNLTLRFSIYYEYEDEFGALQRIPANDPSSPIKNSVVLISLRNLKMRTLSVEEQGLFLTSGPLVSNFPTVLNSDIEGYNNQSSLYYFVGMSSTINYRFGRNTTGIYNFNIITPKYQGVATEDLTPGQRYHYEMYMNLYGETNYYQEKYHLPWMSQRDINMGGIFYAISSPSSNPISRELVIVIKNTTQKPWWGLYDDYTSWDD